MIDFIPFHCLVFCNRERLAFFPPHERLSPEIIALDLVGDAQRDLDSILSAELRHRVGLKLSLGQRVAVAVDATQKPLLASLATNQGARLIDLHTDMPLVQALPAEPLAYLRAHWKGITVVGDLHGDLAALTAVTAWAEARQHFVWFLGDIIDYGADTLDTADQVYQAVMWGRAALILGNHERKIAKWLDHRDNGRQLRVSDSNLVTIRALESLKPVARRQWVGRFRSLLSHTVLMQQIEQITLVHGAVHPTLWTDTPNYPLIEQFALYGESDQSSGRFRRVHRWIDTVPKGQMVFIGHDVMASLPTIVTGAQGGRVVFLDTGCGTGGYLSSADLRFTDAGLHLECFNRHTVP
jgi:protein phosphatase